LLLAWRVGEVVVWIIFTGVAGVYILIIYHSSIGKKLAGLKDMKEF
jgi:hypothetical protein